MASKKESFKRLTMFTRRIREEIEDGYRFTGDGAEWTGQNDVYPESEQLDFRFGLERQE